MNDTVVIDSINYSTEAIPYVTLDHKTNLVLIFRNWDLYFIWKLNKSYSIDVWFGQYLKIWNLRQQKNLNRFKVAQINNQKLSFDIFTVQNIFMEHDLYLIF